MGKRSKKRQYKSDKSIFFVSPRAGNSYYVCAIIHRLGANGERNEPSKMTVHFWAEHHKRGLHTRGCHSHTNFAERYNSCEPWKYHTTIVQNGMSVPTVETLHFNS